MIRNIKGRLIYDILYILYKKYKIYIKYIIMSNKINSGK